MFRDILTKRFWIYVIRWIVSGFVMLPFMLIMKEMNVPFTANVIAGQIIGAFIFYNIDKLIFRQGNGKQNNNQT